MSQDSPDSNPYRNSGGAPANGQGSSALKIVLIVLGIGGFLCLLCCGGALLFSYWAVDKGMEVVEMGVEAYNEGVEVMKTAIHDNYGDHPDVVEHIGDIESLDTDLFNPKYEEYTQKQMIPFKVQGSKGDGAIIVGQGELGEPSTVTSGLLILPDGQEFDLD